MTKIEKMHICRRNFHNSNFSVVSIHRKRFLAAVKFTHDQKKKLGLNEQKLVQEEEEENVSNKK